jgi:hypothetical protein
MQLNATVISFSERNKDMYIFTSFSRWDSNQFMLAKNNMLTLLVARACSNVFRMWRGGPHLVASMLSESLLPVRQESGGTDQGGGPAPPLPIHVRSTYCCRVQGPDNSSALGLIQLIPYNRW